MKMPLLRYLLCFTTGLYAVTSLADQVILSNGDRLSGTLIEQNIDQIVIETSYAGKVTVKRSEISGLSTDHALRLQLHDGRLIDGILKGDQPTGLSIETVDGQQIPLSGLDAIAAIGVIPSDKPAQYEWRGNVTLSGEAKSGNTDTDKLNISTRVVAEKKNDNRFTLGAMLAREHVDDRLTKEQYRLSGKYDHFFRDKWYGFVATSFEQDPFRDIDLRSTLSVGSGYQFYDTDELRLSLEAGLSYTDTRFVEDEDDSYAGFNWGLNWEQSLLGDRLQFFHRHRGNQGLDSSDNLIINAQTGIRVPIAAGLSASAEYDLDWDRSPPDNTKSTDHTYLLGVGYDW
jgi:putative salt-induced outer membrane protein YdiY